MGDLTTILVGTVSLTVPILLAALGGLLSERAGVLALGLEGFMLVGAYAAVVIAKATSSASLGALGGALAGALLAAACGYLVVRVRLNQVVVGLVVIILAIGATTFVNSIVLSRAGTFFERAPGLSRLPIPLLSDIPVVGPAFFNQNVLVYSTYVAAAGLIYYLMRSHSGMRLAAVGEHPLVAETRGIHVNRVKMVAVTASGLLAGAGGAMLSIGILNSFTPEMTGGRGFIALAAIIFAGWRPLAVVGASVLFGSADALQLWLNATGVGLPPQLLTMLPYVLTLTVLALLSDRRPPAALGVPFYREQR